jgi:arylsulfatase A-like enzyme
MARRRTGPALRLLLLLLLAGCSAERHAERVVLITIDTLRADHVDAYGGASGATPTLDQLAASGVRFENAISPTPLTLPSHTTILTGLDPPRHGVHNNGLFHLDASTPLLQESFASAGFATAAFVGCIVLDRQYGLARGFDRYGDQTATRLAASLMSPPERSAGEVVDEALAWLESAGERFFLWVHLYDPHADHKPPAPFDSRFEDLYLGEIAYADAQVARLIQALAQYGDDRTLIAVTSDHGESRGEHGESTHGLSLYEATQHVPLILSGVGLPRGASVPETVRLADVAPTLLRIAGLDPLPEVAGRDLLPLVSGREAGDRPAYIETLATRFDFGWSALYGLRVGEQKYIRAPRPELYDLEEDPKELRNLAPTRPDDVAAFDAALEALLGQSAPVQGDVILEDSRRLELESLGYLLHSSSAPIELGVVGGVDPKDGLRRLDDWTLGVALIQRGRWREAFHAVRTLPPGGPVFESVRSYAAVQAGDPVAAERYARIAIELTESGFQHGRLSLAEAFEAQERFDEATLLLREEAERDQSSGYAVRLLGRIAEARGDREAAARLYREAFERRGGSIEARWRLAALHLEDGASEQAEALLARLPEEETLRPAAAARLVQAELRAARPAQAKERLDRALALYPRADDLLALSTEIGGDAPDG